jgi:hypothetical protein
VVSFGFSGSAAWQAKRIKRKFHANELIPYENQLRAWSVLGNVNDMHAFLRDIREGRISDEEILQRMKNASTVTTNIGIAHDTSPESDALFYAIATNFFENRIRIHDEISVLKSKGSRPTQNEAIFYSGREYNALYVVVGLRFNAHLLRTLS